jgi:hypothetical protein
MTTQPAGLNEISQLLQEIISHNLRYKGRQVESYSPESEEIFTKLLPADKAVISVGKYKYFLYLIYSKQYDRFEKEFQSLLN